MKKPPEKTARFQPKTLAELACTNNALRRASRRLGNLYDEALAPLSMTASQLGFLSEIEKCRDHDDHCGVTLQELAGRMGIQMSAVTHAMKPLLRDEMVELARDAKDARSKRCVLTAIGKARLQEAMVLWAQTNERVERILGAESAQMLRAMADAIASEDFLEQYQADAAGL
jgi:DNA-binding MarR family transcriptional regulator